MMFVFQLSESNNVQDGKYVCENVILYHQHSVKFRAWHSFYVVWFRSRLYEAMME